LVSSTFILGRPGKSGNTGIALTYYIYCCLVYGQQNPGKMKNNGVKIAGFHIKVTVYYYYITSDHSEVILIQI
jgi:hypothetical protein